MCTWFYWTVFLHDRAVGSEIILNSNRQFFVFEVVCGTWLLQTDSVYQTT